MSPDLLTTPETLANQLQQGGICLVAGEASGDVHGAFLMDALRQEWAARGISNIHFWGIGGPLMAAQGCKILIPTDDLAVMGVGEVVDKYPKISQAHHKILHALKQNAPLALICCDYPGFNLRLTEEAYGLGIITCYHIPPKAWSHGLSRTQRLKEFTYLVTCILPFEEAFFKSYGVNALFVGNPLRDATQKYQNDHHPIRHPFRIALLPGSRHQELKRILPVLLEAFVQLSMNDNRFHAQIPVAHTLDFAAVEQQVQRFLTDLGKNTLWQKKHVTLVAGDTYGVLATSRYAWVCSGTATLETAFLGTPFALVYKTSWLTVFLARLVLKIPYVGLVNLCAQKEMVSEFLQEHATAQNLVAHAQSILANPAMETDVIEELAHVRNLFPLGGASRAAHAIADICTEYGALSPAARWKRQRRAHTV